MNEKNREKGEDNSAVVEKNIRNEGVKALASGNQSGSKPKPSASRSQETVEQDVGTSRITKIVHFE